VNRRRRAGWVLLVGFLAGAVWVAPLLDPMHLLPIAGLWLIAAASLMIAVFARIRRAWGTGATAFLVVVAVGVPALMVGWDWSGEVGTYLPCRRNWGWLPSYLLRSSPTRSALAEIGPARIKVCYGSPRTRGRRMIGGQPIPFGRLWRTGANEPTTLRLGGPVEIAGIAVADGKASLYTVPGPETWEIVLNRSTGQWGIETGYAEVQEFEIGRAVVPARPSSGFVEALRLEWSPPVATDSVDLVIRWEGTEVRVPVVSSGREATVGKIQDPGS
jgi:hypothetical protein